MTSPEFTKFLKEMDAMPAEERAAFRADGLSWTHDYSKAEFFANYTHYREEDTPRIIEGKVRTRDIIAIFDGRNENEVVVANPDHVYDRKVSVIE